MPVTIQGQLERITYYNEENNYTVARLQVKGHRDLVTAVGCLAGVNLGETLELEGEWVFHEKFGRQFKFYKYTSVAPATVNGIEKYLSSGLIRGIGPVFAQRIVDRFGLQTLEVIENGIDQLQQVEGIGPKRLEKIARAWQEQREVKDIMIFLQSYGVGATHATKIYKTYGRDAIARVKENPYRLATDIEGIGFITADKIARSLGVEPNSIIRAEAGVVYVLNQFVGEGHVYYPYEALVAACQEILKVEREIVTEAIARLYEAKRIVIEDINEDLDAFKENYKAVYLPAYHTAETGIAQKLYEVIHRPHSLRPINVEKALKWIEEKLGIQLAENQKKAISLATQNKVLVITGGPGTGKTTIVRAIVNIFSELRCRILLAAPTGRAAKRLFEATGWEAKTIHRLLQFNFAKGGFLRNQKNPLDVDVLIVDEASMIDCILMYHLLKAIPSHTILIIVGDVNQLPSVGAGNVLRDIIDSKKVEVIELNKIFRQEEDSLIIVNAHRINEGQFPALPASDKNRLHDFYFIEESQPEKILDIIKDLCTKRVPEKFNLDPIGDVQVLTPVHRGEIGASNLNAELQNVLNPSSVTIVRGGRIFKLNDKVMQTRNNYEKDVYNGDIGKIVAIDQEDQEITVRYDSGEIKYAYSELDEIVHAYCISCHKSQGSEYPAVIIPIITQHYMLLQRNLLYTAVTRAKKLVVLVGTKKALSMAIHNNKIQHRYTYLRQRLVDARESEPFTLT